MNLLDRKRAAETIVTRHAGFHAPPVWPDSSCYGMVADVLRETGRDPKFAPKPEASQARMVAVHGGARNAWTKVLAKFGWTMIDVRNPSLPLDLRFTYSEKVHVPAVVGPDYMVYGWTMTGFGVFTRPAAFAMRYTDG